MKKTKRWFALLTAILMLIAGLAACREPSDEAETTTDKAQETDTNETDSNLDEKGFVKDNLPDDLDFGGLNVRVLYWSDVERPEFEVTEITGDVVGDAIFQRNMNIEDRLGVDYLRRHTRE